MFNTQLISNHAPWYLPTPPPFNAEHVEAPGGGWEGALNFKFMATTTKYNYTGVAVAVTDNRAKWEADKPVTGVIAQYDSVNNALSLIVPEVQKRDTTKNPALVSGEKTGMEVTVHKDGSYGFSWKLKAGELRLVGKAQTIKEFRQCMDVYFDKILNN